jgi:nitroimidazol reductase NimA-like FMN-containing flavoprotein (pyridoxamine 5'-phosphate oxidase superfamily)
LKLPQVCLPGQNVEKRLVNAINYWLSTTQPNGQPHVVPKWGVWIDDCFYFDGSPETKHARNLLTNPHAAVHLESGDAAVIVYGVGQAIARPEQPVAEVVARLYREKYQALGYAPEPNQWDNGGLFVIQARKVLAWTKFTEDPNRFTFTGE